MPAFEVNFDGLVGPTHNYAGLAFGNLASQQHRAALSKPREAALQGLAKMRKLRELGLIQGVLAPQERPDIATLRQLGFQGNDAQVLKSAQREAPRLLAACCSASSMWAANTATLSPSSDTRDQRFHITPANLCSTLHRSLEPATSARLLQSIFADGDHFVHHPPLPAVEHLSDEGAANHNRLCDQYENAGTALFVYGRSSEGSRPAPRHYPARQTLQASQAVARSHGLNPRQLVFAQQHPNAIDQGVFHNDVIAVANRNLLFCHQQAFIDQANVIAELEQACDFPLQVIEVPNEAVSVTDAVASYLFNSQLINLDEVRMALVLPEECRQNSAVSEYLAHLASQNTPIDEFHFMDLKQSMRNGGGPACLRLRAVLTQAELEAVNPAVLLDDGLYQRLVHWINKHYRDRLQEADLADPALLNESRRALDELTQLLQLGSIYPFQRG